MKKELKMRLAVAGFMQETLQQMVSKRKNVGDASDSGAGAKEVIIHLTRLFIEEILIIFTVRSLISLKKLDWVSLFQTIL